MAKLSQIYREQGRLEATQRIEDGFQDLLEGTSGLVVDRGLDEQLDAFVERCRKKLRKAKDEAAQAMVLALLVSESCGRSGREAADLAARFQQRLHAGELLMGELLGELGSSPERPERRKRSSGAALAPQRALLFKAVADWLGLVPCSLLRQEVTLNLVTIASNSYVVDLLFDPGALYEEPSPKAREYRRLAAGGSGEAPSARRDLEGFMPRPPWHVEPWQLEITRDQRIGRGGFGEVFHGRWAGAHVAVKEMKDNAPNDGDVMDFFLEIAVLSQLNHPNIVRFWRGSTEMHGGRRSLLMVTEYIKQGGLSRLLHGHGGPALPEPLTLPQALSMALDVARGVQYLHSQRILHLDLKSPNVLCAPVWTAKLCDFGLAKMRGEATHVQSTIQGVSPVWAPPEMFEGGGLTEKADVYSFAVIFFELLTKQLPFSELSAAQLPAAKMKGYVPEMPSKVPVACGELIGQCCVADAARRPSMGGVQARLREIAQQHDIQLSEVKPPAALAKFDDDQQRRVQQAEDAAAKKLMEVDQQRAQLKAELAEMHRKIEAVRKRAAEMSGPAGSAGYTAPAADTAWCDAFIQEVAGLKFRCMLCGKLFRGPEFVKMHLEAKHKEEAKRLIEDKYFDCDVSKEDAMPSHRAMGKTLQTEQR